MSRCVIVHFVGQRLEPGYTFDADNWPLHITIIPPFASEVEHDEAVEQLKQLLRSQQPIKVVAGDDTMFGKRHNVPVTLIEPHKELMQLHLSLLEYYAKNAGLNNMRHVGAKFRPHTRVKKTERISKGQLLSIDNVSLVNMRPDGDKSQRRVLSTTEFGLEGR